MLRPAESDPPVPDNVSSQADGRSVLLRGVAHLPAALLIVVAVHQLAATVYGDLTPWLGGGFGMFATLDTPGNRVVSAHLLEPGIRREIDVPLGLQDVATRALAFPTEQRLTDLARDLLADPRYADHVVEGLELSVWRVRPTPDPVRTVRVDVNP